MTHKGQSVSKYLARFGAVLVVAAGASACSSMPNWVDPTNWIGGSDDQTASQPDDQNTQTADNGQKPDNAQTTDENQTVADGLPADNTQTADKGVQAGTLPDDNTQTAGNGAKAGTLPADNTQSADEGLKAGTQATDATQTADNAQTPDLATIPDKPTTQSTPDEQKQVAQSLASDRAKAQYSGDALKGGTEAAAAPPPAEPAPQTEELAANDNPPAQPSAPAESASASAPRAGAQNAPAVAPEPAPQTQVASAAVPAAPAYSPPAMPASSGVPAVPAMGPQIAQSDSALGFHPSAAPPLDPSVSQFVPASILARYRQTASIGSGAAVPNGPLPAVSDPSTGMGGIVVGQNLVGPSKPARTKMGVGGPERMSGAVVANFESIDPSGAAVPAAFQTNSAGPAAVVFFPHDTTILDAQAKLEVRAAAQAFLARGGQGFVKVVGHSSSHPGNSPVANHLVRTFEQSQARASAVARALITAGVPANKVLVEAVGDDHPVYLDSTPQGEDGNRRAEIFFQT